MKYPGIGLVASWLLGAGVALAQLTSSPATVPGSVAQPGTIASQTIETVPTHPTPVTGTTPQSPQSPQVFYAPAGPHPEHPPSDMFSGEMLLERSAFGRFWGELDILVWWIKDAPNPVPLLTTGPQAFAPGTPGPTLLTNPATQIIFGASDIGYDPFTGTRLSLGWWLDSDEGCGVEMRGFILERGAQGIRVDGDQTASKLLSVPFYDAFPPITGENVNALQVPGLRQGFFESKVNTRVGGFEANVLYNLSALPALHIDGLAGFRYYDLQEDMFLQQTYASVTPLFPLPFNGGTVASPEALSIRDVFKARNKFYGGQFGFILRGNYGRLFTRFRTDVAFGGVQQLIDITGTTTRQTSLTNPTALQVVPGGMFAVQGNLGRRTRAEFAVLPTAEVQLGYQFTPNLSAHVGYSFMYITRVARPGTLIDRGLDSSRIPASVNYGSPLGGDGRPIPVIENKEFWTMGVDLGLTLSF